MRREFIVPAAAAALLLLTVATTPYARAAAPSQVFDPAAVETFEAEILQVSSTDLGGGTGLHLIVRNAAGESLEVRVGPEWYLAERGMELAVGDRIELSAATVRTDEGPVYIVASLRKGERNWVLRDETGQPAWARSSVAAGSAPGRGGVMQGQGQGPGNRMMHGQGMRMGRGQGNGMMHGQGSPMGQGRSGCMMRGRDQQTQGEAPNDTTLQGRGTQNGQGMMQRQGQMGCAQAADGAGLGQAGPMCRRDATGSAAAAPDASENGATATSPGCACGCAMREEPVGAR